MEEMEKIRQTEEQKTPKGSLLGSIFFWGSKPQVIPKKPTLKQELEQILDIINEAKMDANEEISLIECEFLITLGKIKLYQQVKSSKETVEFRYQGLHLNYMHCSNQDLVKVKMAGIEFVSIGSNGGEVTKFIHVSDPNEDYLDCEMNLIKKDDDFFISAKLNAVIV